MRLEFEINDDDLEDLMIHMLQRTIKYANDPTLSEMYPDKDELVAACERLIAYYSPPPAKD